MASKKHLQILSQGVMAWNEWMEKHPEVHPNFRNANLKDAKLSGVNLRQADLSGADLRGADLFRADLTGTTMIKTNL